MKERILEFKADMHCIFKQCPLGGWSVVVVCSAVSFWIGVVVG